MWQISKQIEALKGNKQAFQWRKLYCQEALLQLRHNQPTTNVLTYCAKFKSEITLGFKLL